MVALHTYSTAGAHRPAALDALAERIASDRLAGGLAVVFYGSSVADEAVQNLVARALPATPVLGGTSSQGLMCGDGLLDHQSVGLLVIEDEGGAYGVSAGEKSTDPETAARSILLDALDAAGCPGELPHLVWVYQAPGHEEQVIAGLRSVLGDNCPIIGGSSADDEIAGHWRQFTPDGALQDGIAVAVLFPSGGVSYAFQSGYEPTGQSGIVTGLSGDIAGKGGRELTSIDGRPAAEVYNDWLGNTLQSQLVQGGNILAETSMAPLAIEAGSIEGIPQYLLIHPESIGPEATLRTFAAIAQGTRVHLMSGERRLLIERAGNVALEAATRLPDGSESLAGALLVYCAGCMMAVGPQMPEVASQLTRSLRGLPFIGCFTFGEQGQIAGRNMHGNLMISAVAFGR